MRRTIDTDWGWQALMRPYDAPGAIPRRTVYGRAPGLIPFGEAYPEKLLDPRDYKEVIADCHAKKIFPMYHQESSWAPSGFRWNQDGLNYCWAWGLCGALMTTRALEEKPVVQLAPVSLGWTVRWRNAGNYLESAITGGAERGFCDAAYVPSQHSLNPTAFQPGWEENAIQYRVGDVLDSRSDSLAVRIQYMLSMMADGTPLYNAYHWWGHATGGPLGVIWDETVPNNLRVLIRNSHNEDDLLELTGNRAIPDEMFGICSTLT
jgi:hypothetical protein